MICYAAPGADPGFLLGGGALVSCSTSTPINHIAFFFFAQYQLYYKTAGHLRGGAHPLHPRPRYAPDYNANNCILSSTGFASLPIGQVWLSRQFLPIFC